VELAAIADTNATLAEDTAREFDIPRWYMDPLAMMDDPSVQAIVIVGTMITWFVAVLVARWGYRLPYVWSRMRANRDGDLWTWSSRRR